MIFKWVSMSLNESQWVSMSLNGMGSYDHLPRVQETSLVIYCILVSYCILVRNCIPVERLRSESHFRLVFFSIYQKGNNCLNYLTHLWDVLEQLRGVEVQHSCWKAQWPKYKGWKNRWHIWRPWQRPIWCRKGQAHSRWPLCRRFPAHCHCPIRLGNIVCQQLSIALQRKKRPNRLRKASKATKYLYHLTL